MKILNSFLIIIIVFVFSLILLMYSHKNNQRNIDAAQIDLSVLQWEVEMLTRRVDSIETSFEALNIDSLIKKEKEWLMLKFAIAKVESSMMPNAVNPRTGAGGLFQIMPDSLNGFLREANRLARADVFTNDCRFEPEQATLMFEIVNQRHNPGRDIDRAIQIHNPLAGRWYYDRVMREFDFLQKLSFTIQTTRNNSNCVTYERDGVIYEHFIDCK